MSLVDLDTQKMWFVVQKKKNHKHNYGSVAAVYKDKKETSASVSLSRSE